jgi:hypothetical protein
MSAALRTTSLPVQRKVEKVQNTQQLPELVAAAPAVGLVGDLRQRDQEHAAARCSRSGGLLIVLLTSAAAGPAEKLARAPPSESGSAKKLGEGVGLYCGEGGRAVEHGRGRAPSHPYLGVGSHSSDHGQSGCICARRPRGAADEEGGTAPMKHRGALCESTRASTSAFCTR